MPISVKKSDVPFPRKIDCCHVVTWKGDTIVWRDYTTNLSPVNAKDVYVHSAGNWIKKETSGHNPLPYMSSGQAHVLNANMFVLSKDSGPIQGTTRPIRVYSLNLSTCKWTKLIPSGFEPIGHVYGITSWIHNEKIYFFGIRNNHYYDYHMVVGLGETSNQIFCYNISTNSWEWPNTYGDIPSPRQYAQTISTKRVVFLFGGDLDGHNYNDLYMLEKDTLKWRAVHGNIPEGQGPSGRGRPTFTRISKSVAVLFDSLTSGNRHEPLVDNSWLFDIDKAEQLMNPTTIWTKIKIPRNLRRRCHAAVLEPMSRQLWVIGGQEWQPEVDLPRTTSDVLHVNLIKLAPLKNVAIHHAVQSICINDPRLAEDRLPRHLKSEIEAYRSETPGDNACTLRNKCIACLLATNLNSMNL